MSGIAPIAPFMASRILGADREQNLDQRGPQKPLGRNRRPAIGRVKPGKLRIERRQRGVDDLPDLAQRVRGRNPLLKIARMEASRASKRRESYSYAPVSRGFFSDLLEVLASPSAMGSGVHCSSIFESRGMPLPSARPDALRTAFLLP